jgi:hypothetical protein
MDETQPASSSPRINLFGRVVLIFTLFVQIILIAGVILSLWFMVSPYLAIAIVLYILALFAFGFYRRRQNKMKAEHIAAVQKQALEMTGAELLGSAVHVAGHARLERNQPVVIALTQRELNIYPYDKAEPLDVLLLKEIETIQTVVYDEDRIPHVDVIDPTAQALQITFHREGQTWKCLFNRMRIHRPIDWYQAIQKAKAGQRLA